MSQNDYIILRDENGKAYIAHAGLLDNARNAIRGAANSISTTAQQVANKAKGVGRGVRQNHKYILKVNENGRTRYFYKQEEVKAYYEAKRKGIKNPAEYAQKVADTASNAVDAVKSTLREASGYAAKDRMNTAAAKRDELNKAQNQKHEAWIQAKKAKDQADVKTFQATIESEMANEKAKKSNVFNRKQRETDAKTASDQQKQYAAKSREAGVNEQKAKRELDKAIDAYNKNAEEEYDNRRLYEKSLAGRVDRTTAAASSAYSKAKDSANNAVSNAKNAYERMRGEFRDKAEQASNAAKSAANKVVDKAKDFAGYDEKERLDKATDIRNRASENAKNASKYISDALRSSKDSNYDDRFDAAIKIRDERWKAEDNANADYWRAREAYDKTPLGMINRAKEAISSATDSVRDVAKDATEAVARIPKAAKNAAEDVAFNAQYYSKQLKEGITGEKATKMASDIREEAQIWKNRADDTKDKDLKNFYKQQYQKAEDFAKRFDAQAAKSLKGRANSAVNSVQGMIDNARSSTAKAVNEAWDKIPKNSDGTVNPFDKNFQYTYNDWKAKKDKYDSSLAGRAKDAAEKATDTVQDMIDQAKKVVKGNAGSNLTREQEQTNTDSRQTKRTQEEMNEMRNKKSDFEQGYDDFIKTMGEYGKIRDRIARHGLLSAEESRFNDQLYQIEQDVLDGKLTPTEAVRKAEQMEEEAKSLKKVQLQR